ncbi:hypothetical protein CCP3SC5AM1_2640003 [Gammaproteobacteria bacterium]
MVVLDYEIPYCLGVTQLKIEKLSHSARSEVAELICINRDSATTDANAPSA